MQNIVTPNVFINISCLWVAFEDANPFSDYAPKHSNLTNLGAVRPLLGHIMLSIMGRCSPCTVHV